jgi:SAM-dependent methyltransferase
MNVVVNPTAVPRPEREPSTSVSMTRCPICSGKSDQFNVDHSHCPHCDYWYSQLPADVTNTDAPDNEYELVSYEHTRSANYNAIIDQLRLLHPAGGRLLEIGCADGLFLKLAAERGFTGFGIEPNVKMIAANIHQQDIRQGFFPDVIEGSRERFDVIALNCVLEHIPSLDTFLGHMRRFLKPGGTIAINVPVASGLLFKLSRQLYRVGIKYPWERMWQTGFVSPHLSFFTTKGISSLFKKNGLRLIKEHDLLLFSLGGIFARLSLDPSIRFVQRTLIGTLLYLYYPISRTFPDSKVFFFREIR